MAHLTHFLTHCYIALLRFKTLKAVVSSARVVELVDTLDSGSSSRKAVEVRVLSRAPEK